MKRAKKFLSLITAATLIVLPVSPAFAGTTITGVTKVDYVDPKGVIVADAPTSASLNFTLNPQGLSAVEGVGNWVPANGGSILPVAVGIMTNKSQAPVKAEISFTLSDTAGKVKLLSAPDNIDADTENNMYFTITPAKAKVSAAGAAIAVAATPTYFQIGDPKADKVFTAADMVAMGLNGSSTNVKILADEATAVFGDFVCQASNTDIADAAALAAYDFATDAKSITFKQVEIPAHAVIPETKDVTVNDYNNTTTGFADSTSKVVLAQSGTGLAYKLANADYYAAKTAANVYELRRYSYNYSTVKNDNYDTASFVIGGQINKNADWSDYTTGGKTISLGAVYSFSFMTADEYTNTTKLGSSYNSIAYSAPAAPSISTTSYPIDKDTTEDVVVSLGSGNLAAAGIASVKDGSTTLSNTTDYTYSASTKTITFTTAYVNGIIGTGAANASKALTVTFNDTAGTTANITLDYTAVNVAPSVTTTTLSFSKAAPVDKVINYSLGSGTSKATAVSQVYIEGPSGKFELLSDTQYSSYVSVNTTNSTITIKKEWLGAYAAGVSAKIHVRFDMTKSAADATSFTTPQCTISITN